MMSSFRPQAFRSLAFGLVLSLAGACACMPVPPSNEPSNASGGSSGSSGSGGSSAASGGAPGSGGGGGSPAASGGNGGTSTPSATGGATGGTTGGTSSGSGGSSAASGGSSGGDKPDAGTETGPGPSAGGRPVKPSAGCGKANPATGARTITTGGKAANYIVTLPAGYDANKPVPMGLAFHGYGLNEKTCAAGSECPGYKNLPAITVYLKSIGPGWEYPLNLLEPNIKFFEDVVTTMKAEYCVDENRIFVAGVSSGGQFVEHLACRFGDWLWTVSPIAAYVDKGTDMNCKGTPSIIVIHGITDNLEKNAHAVRDMFAKRNGCPTVPAGMAEAEEKMKAARAATRKETACLDYEGCTNAPLRFCVFSQITYNNLTHGWPDNGGTLINEFLDKVAK
jgi:poly(3-hydroxybutyrate) depolymerase